MPKILALNGSPRKTTGGHTWALLDALIASANKHGAEVKVYDLNSPGVRGCQGCFACRTEEECVIDDELKPVYGEMAEATGLVFLSPVYFADTSAQAKIFIDRMLPMLDGRSFAPRHPGKKMVCIFSQGDGNPDRFMSTITRTHGFFRTFGWDVEDTLVCAGTSRPGFAIPDELLERARAAGEILAK